MYADNDIDNRKINCLEIATSIAKWCESNYGYFIRASGDKLERIKDLSEQIERLNTQQQNSWHRALNQHYDMGLNIRP